MKKIMLSLMLLSGTASLSIAQSGTHGVTSTYTVTERHPRTPQEATDWTINFFAEKLNLTTEQKKVIYDPILKFEREVADAENYEEKMSAILQHHLYMQQELQNILTYTQYLKYQQIEQYPDGVVNPNLLSAN